MDHVRDFPTSPHFRSASMAEAASRRYWRRPSTAKALMIKNLRDRLFGSRQTPTANVAALKKEKTLAKINEADATSAKPRTRRTVGLTEARLRAANQQSWMTSTKGWSDFFGRFTASSKR